jgi:anti-sigma regulatory factor (Ser/Thr protein kinase)
VDVELRGMYLLNDHDRLVRDLMPLLVLDHRETIVVDLRSLAFIGPTCLGVLLAALKRAQALGFNGERSTILPPKSRLTRTYLYRMDLFRLVAGDLPEEFERHEPQGFRPCQQFDESNAVVVARELSGAISERVAADELANAAIYVALSELAENVGFHADTALGGFAVAQSWRARPEIELAIVDLGVGIRTSLAKIETYADIDDDVTAIKTALEPLVTSRPGTNRGFGLAFTRGLLRGNGGELMVRSGAGAVYSGGSDLEAAFGTWFPGTIVALTVRTDRPLDQHDGWRAIDEAELGV